MDAVVYALSKGYTDAAIPAWAKQPEKPTYNKTEVGLGNVSNLAPADLPVSNATAEALATKVNKDGTKVLSTNDYSTLEKEKLQNIEAGAQKNVKSDWNISDNSSDAFIANKPTIGTMAAEAKESYRTAAQQDTIDNTHLTNIIAGSNVTVTANGQERTISVTGVNLPDKFTSTENGLGTIGANNTYDSSLLTPIIVGLPLAPDDLVIFANGYQGEVTVVNGGTYDATTILQPQDVSWGNIGGTISNQGDLVAELAKKVNEVEGMGLSQNSFSNDEKNKLAGIAIADGDIAGLVKTSNVDLQVAVDSSGFMSVNGLSTILADKVDETDFTNYQTSTDERLDIIEDDIAEKQIMTGTVTLEASNWALDGDVYKQTISYVNAYPEANGWFYLAQSTDDSDDIVAASGPVKLQTVTTQGSLTFTVPRLPTDSVNVFVVRFPNQEIIHSINPEEVQNFTYDIVLPSTDWVADSTWGYKLQYTANWIEVNGFDYMCQPEQEIWAQLATVGNLGMLRVTTTGEMEFILSSAPTFDIPVHIRKDAIRIPVGSYDQLLAERITALEQKMRFITGDGGYFYTDNPDADPNGVLDGEWERVGGFLVGYDGDGSSAGTYGVVGNTGGKAKQRFESPVAAYTTPTGDVFGANTNTILLTNTKTGFVGASATLSDIPSNATGKYSYYTSEESILPPYRVVYCWHRKDS